MSDGPMIIGGLEPGTLPHVCDCGRTLGLAPADGTTKFVECPCGKVMAIADLTMAMQKPRKFFVMSSGEK